MEQATPADTPKVLLVDDEEHILKALRRLLMDEEMEILTASSGEMGLELLGSTEGVEVIVSDQRMPGLSGAEFLQQAKEIAPDALRIMLTGYADINATIDAINKGGAYRYVSKPWNDQELILIIRDAVRQCRLVSENRRLSALVQKQNQELKEWNDNLKSRVLEQTAALRVNNTKLRELNQKLTRNFENCLTAFSTLVELRDRETETHSRKVAQTAVMIAEAAKVSVEETEQIKVAALLHDIGKIGMKERLLRMEVARMDPCELAEYHRHALLGQSAIDSIEDMRPAGIVIRHHHENYDGSGFPDGLKGAGIPLGSRIIALADSFDHAFAANRADNAIEMSLRMMKADLGTRFDPYLFPLLEKPVGEIYAKLRQKSSMVEMELHPGDLREGMIIAREVRSGTGLLLLGVGESLDIGKIHSLKRYYLIDPPAHSETVMVYARS